MQQSSFEIRRRLTLRDILFSRRSISRRLPRVICRLLASIALALALLQSTSESYAQTAPRPNIVFIMADDLGINDLGVYGQNARKAAGQDYISTPNLDALAKTGVRFTEWYTPATVCGPTRASVLTGFHGGHAAVDSNGLNNNGGNALRAVDTSFAQGLQSSGYTTGAFGKWGSGMDGTQLSPTATGDNALINHPNPVVTHPDSTPAAKGFDEFYGYLNHIHAHNYYVEYLWEHDTDNSGELGGMQVDFSPTTSDYSHDLIAEKSVQFIRNHAGGSEPFFMYGEYTIPHDDFNPPNDSFLQQYTVGQGLTGNKADYGAMITRLDHNVGQIVEALEDPDGDPNTDDSVLDNTLIIFGTDNGPAGSTTNGWYDSNGIYRGLKNSVYEGAHRSPFIVSWPGQITPSDPNGDVNSTHMASHTDLFATFSELAGVETPVGLDSRSFAGLLTGEQYEEHDYIVWEDRPSDDWAIRMGRYKLLKAGGLQLYDLQADPSETNNLLGSPNAEQAAVALLLERIALDEGVESDVGSGGAQNTHIVQYKSWDPVAASSDFEDAANWSGGSQLNTRGTAANNFTTGPANNWIPTLDNTSGSPQQIIVDSNSEVLAFEMYGSTADLEMLITQNSSLMARNGARIGDGAKVELDGGQLNTVRTIEIQAGGTLAGRGELSTSYDTSGTPFTLEAEVHNQGTLDVGGQQAFDAGTPDPIEIVSNGGFESGTAFSYNDTDDWYNYTGNQTLNARNSANPSSGSFRGIIGLSSSGLNEPAPAQDTGHLIALDDVYTLSFDYAGASEWEEGIDQFVVSLYYVDGGLETDLFSWNITPSLDFNSGYEQFSVTTASIGDPAIVGQELRIRFQTLGQSSEFASIDNVSLMVGELSDPLNILSIEGGYTQTAQATAAFDLWGSGGVAGVDFDQLVATGEVLLDGMLQITESGGFTASIGNQFPIIVGGSVTGEFAEILGPTVAGGRWHVDYSATTATLALLYAADFDADGDVDDTDLAMWSSGYGTSAAGPADGDANGDGLVNGADFLIWQQQAGSSATLSIATASQAVPEPASWHLLALGWCLFLSGIRCSRD